MSTDRNKVRSAVEVFLDAKRVTLYLDWDITTDTGKAHAIEYLTDLYLDLEEQIEKQFKDYVGEGYRRPVDGKEAVQANDEGVLERCMDGIPGGPGGWERNGLLDAHVLQGLGKFRVPADWKSRMDTHIHISTSSPFVEGATESTYRLRAAEVTAKAMALIDRDASKSRHPSSTAVIETTGSVADETLRPLRKTERTPSSFLPTPSFGQDAGL